jgi:Mg-dependent DNase
MASYVDTHCHLDLLPDPAHALDAASNTIVVAVTELPSRYRLLSTRFRNDHRVRVSLGLHPLRAATAGAMEEGLLVRLLDRTDYVGEVGLDFSKQGRETRHSQLRVFERLLAEPSLRRKVVSVHSRGADPPVIKRLREAGVRAILHWYTGPPGPIDDALSAGMYFSINPAMLRTEKGRAVIAAVPIDRVLTESDAPFAKFNGASSAPSDMTSVVAALARRWDMTGDDARHVVHDNFESLRAITVDSVAQVPDTHEISLPTPSMTERPQGETRDPP